MLKRQSRSVILPKAGLNYADLNFPEMPCAEMPQTVNERQNINISAYRVLFILSLLVQHQSISVDELNQYLYDNPLIQRTYNSETITKYINTLRRVGCQIPKHMNRVDYRYVLAENPFPIILSEQELDVALALLDKLAGHMDESLQRRYLLFLQQIAWMLETPQREQLELKLASFKPDWTILATRQLIQRFEELCRDALALEVRFRKDSQHDTVIRIEPIRVIQQGKRAYLLGLKRSTHEQVKLDLKKILDVRQMPDKINVSAKQSQVIFQLYGRLAKTYRLYPNEELVFTQGDTVQIRAKTDDLNGLLNRLLKYNTLCQVIAPSSARQEMRYRITSLIQTASQGVDL